MDSIAEKLIASTVNGENQVRAWEESVMLPAYEVGAEEKNPIFLEKRVYQGSSGSVYPYAVVEKISDEKILKPYKALFLENEYLKIMILPELGGRIQMAYDKTKKRHFVYYNQVIKPALVGLTGPWISGGIEFNWPQHHRPSTFLPTDYSIEKNPDGSWTVWCGEVERMFHTKGMHGCTLYPGKAYLEIKAKIYNRTPFPQTFLWWANPAVAVKDAYHSVFPPDVHAVFDHGKRDVSTFPIATGVYYKCDYSAGVDISKYKNIPVPTSYMAVKSKYDFVGGYEEDVEAGLLHVANHNVSPGKKQWTWGCGDFGRAWDRNLTDEDGPYIELMTGVYTDNQPDFSWLNAYEEKSWTQYFMPYTKVGYVKNANKDLILNIEIKNKSAAISIYATGRFENLKIYLSNKNNRKFFCESFDISPAKPYEKNINVGKFLPQDVLLEIKDKDGRLLISYIADEPQGKALPSPAKPAKDPKDISSIEQLYLTGLHLEQYRHATYSPIAYYQEALKREPSDIRCNNAMGLWLMRKGQFEKALDYFKRAIETQTERNPNPYDGEAYYNLGWCYFMQENFDGAYEAFFKSAWNDAWQAGSYFSLAQIDTRRTLYVEALDRIDRAIIKNWHNHKARHLKSAILRKMGMAMEALALIDESLKIDLFNLGVRFEKYLITNSKKDLQELLSLSRDNIHTYIAYALDYANAGMYKEAQDFLMLFRKVKKITNPLAYYALGYFALKDNNEARAKIFFEIASNMSPDGCFSNRIDDVNILKCAIDVNPKDSFANYYLGNFFYAAKQYNEAIFLWEKSAKLNPKFPTVWRNLSLAYYNKRDEKKKALSCLQKAFALDKKDSRIFMELDQLHKKLGVSCKKRLENLQNNMNLVYERDDLFIELISLLNLSGEFEKSKEMMVLRKFHPWEGGEGKITSQYERCRVELAKLAIEKKDFSKAYELMTDTNSYPHNLGEGKLSTVDENDLHYFKAICLQGLGRKNEAKEFFAKATKGDSKPQQAFFYNDQQPDKIYFQALAWEALGKKTKSKNIFKSLIAYGKKHMNDNCRIDYFAVSLPELSIWDDDLNKRNKIHCNYVLALGYLGLKQKEKARELIKKILQQDPTHPSKYLA